MSKGLLSIVMVCYNHASYIREALGSVISQTYKNWHLIIVDDGSCDDSVAIINEYIQKYPDKIKLFIHAQGKNLGIIASYALALQHCNGEFIGFLESDDIWEANNAEVKINYLERYPESLVYSCVTPIGDSDAIVKKRAIFTLINSIPHDTAFNAFWRLLFYNFIPGFSSVFVRSETLASIKFLSEQEYPIWLDWFFWFQISRKHKFFCLNQHLVRWRIYKNSYCNTFENTKSKANLIIPKIRFRLRLLKEIFFRNRSA